MEEFDFQAILELLMSGDPVAIGLAIAMGASIIMIFVAKTTKNTETDDKLFSKIYNVLKRLTVKPKDK